MSDHVRRNRAFWDAQSDEYQARHDEFIGGEELRWGIWQIPEAELGVLGDLAGKDVLELGCGAAQKGIKMARRGARVVGLDASARQLAHARRAIARAGVRMSLVLANAEAVPLASASFDAVVCDYGAITFTDPRRTIPEAARLLRPEGLLAFSHASPIHDLCWLRGTPGIGTSLVRDYFSMHRLDDDDGSTSFQLPYGEWIRLFARAGLMVEDLVETRPPEGARSTYRDAEELAWSRRFPAEVIWRTRKRR